MPFKKYVDESLCSRYKNGAACKGYPDSELCLHCNNKVKDMTKLTKEAQKKIEDARLAVRLKKNNKRLKKGKQPLNMQEI